MTLTRSSPCKVNLLLNTLGRRPDGYTELETLFLPVPLFDELSFTRDEAVSGIVLTCSNPALPVDQTNLVHRAAQAFCEATGIRLGLRIQLEKRLPLAAGLGAGSANAAHTLRALNELFDSPLSAAALNGLAAKLGSDVNFFLQDGPALAFGRGERIEAIAPFEALKGRGLWLYHPGFGVPTPWAFQELAARFPDTMKGRPGRAAELAQRLRELPLAEAAKSFYNALERPVLFKHRVLELYQEFLRSRGALGTLMSGSGSTTFAIFESVQAAAAIGAEFQIEFGSAGWMQVVEL